MSTPVPPRIAHFNTAGAGLMSAATLAAMTRQLEQEARFGAYEVEARTSAAADARAVLARLLNAAPAQIALFDSATRAWQTCLHALAPLPRGSVVWLTPYEYAGHLLVLQALARRDGLQLQVMPTTPQGDIDLDWVERQAGPRLALVSLVHMPSACGIVLPVAQLARRIRAGAPQALLAVDACQSAGQLPLDVRAWDCDLLTAAGRKFLRGPRGSGFAFVSARWLARLGDHPLDLHCARVLGLHDAQRTDTDSARQLENSEISLTTLCGLRQAVEEALQADTAPRDALYARLRGWLQQRPGVRLIAPGTVHAGILSFRHARVGAAELVQHLRAAHINAWHIDGAHTPLFMGAIGAPDAVRLSVHCHNTPDDVERLQRALDALPPG